MPDPAPGVVLDTHAWIWLIEGDRRFSAKALTAIKEAAAQGNLFVPAISVWEVAMLEAKGRLVFAMPCDRWVTAALAAPGVSFAPLTPDIAIESCRLPGQFHGDPADRMIVATARIVGAALATRDRRIVAYGTEGHVPVLSV